MGKALASLIVIGCHQGTPWGGAARPRAEVVQTLALGTQSAALDADMCIQTDSGIVCGRKEEVRGIGAPGEFPGSSVPPRENLVSMD